MKREFTANEGLASTKTQRVFQDRRGFLWIGTETGISRYDGHSFVNYHTKHGLPSNTIHCIRQDCSGRLWVGTAKGLAFYDGQQFHTVQLTTDTLQQLNVGDILCSNDTLWISTATRLFMRVKDSVIPVKLPAAITRCRDLQYTTRQGILLATNNGIYHHTSKGFVPLNSLSKAYILNMKVDQQQRIWTTTLDGFVLCWHGSLCDTILNYDEELEFPNRLCIKGNHVYYSGDVDVFEITGKEKIIKVLSCAEDITYFISDFIIDEENQFWLATSYGLIRERKVEIFSYKLSSAGYTNVFSLAFVPGSDSLLAGGLRTLFALKKDSLTTIIPNTNLFKSDLSFITPHPAGGWLLGQYIGGLLWLQPKPRQTLSKVENLSSLSMFSCAKARDSSVWVGSDNYIYHISRNGTEAFSGQPLLPVHFLSILELEDGNILLGTNKGLYLFSRGKFAPVLIKNLSPTLVIRSLAVNKNGDILIGSMGNGLFMVTYKNNEFQLLRTLSTDDGLKSDFIIHALEDHLGQLWLLCSNGIYRIKNYSTPHPLIEYINREDGMPDNSWSFGWIAEDSRGTVYISGSKGLVSLNAAATFGPANAAVPSYILSLCSTSAPGLTISDSLFWNSSSPAVSLPYQAGSIRINFTGISLARPDKVQYSYYLEGFDKTWNTGSANNVVSYNNLPPGEYVFHLMANNQIIGSDGKESVFFITIQTPYWLSWWFRLLIVVTILLALYGLYRWRLNEHIKKQQLQQESSRQISESRFMAFQARMNPHFMFNSLNAIQYFITNNDKQSTLNYLSKFARLLRQILDNSNASKITIEAELQMLKAYLEMENMRFENKFRCSFDIDPDVDVINTEIPGMIIQPFVENAIIHGLLNKEGEGFLCIRISKDEHHIICTVEDDGIGRKRSAEINAGRSPNHRSHGMSIALNRLELLNNKKKYPGNSIEITDLYDNNSDTGTRVIIRLPLN